MKKYSIFARLLTIGMWFITVQPAGAATPDQVDAAIKKAVDYLYRQQTAQGNWDGPAPAPCYFNAGQRNYTGRTALVTYSLLAAGQQVSDKRLMSAVEFLQKNPTTGTYALGVRAQVWPYLK